MPHDLLQATLGPRSAIASQLTQALASSTLNNGMKSTLPLGRLKLPSSKTNVAQQQCWPVEAFVTRGPLLPRGALELRSAPQASLQPPYRSSVQRRQSMSRIPLHPADYSAVSLQQASSLGQMPSQSAYSDSSCGAIDSAANKALTEWTLYATGAAQLPADALILHLTLTRDDSRVIDVGATAAERARAIEALEHDGLVGQRFVVSSYCGRWGEDSVMADSTSQYTETSVIAYATVPQEPWILDERDFDDDDAVALEHQVQRQQDRDGGLGWR
jgi:hypothetical protein